MSSNDLVTEGKRQLRVCNACRYCEGYCAVWRAVERHREFSDKDLAYFANLCHDCRDCYFACPFTAPHEFAINPPKLFSGLRVESYRKYAWPNGWTRLLGRRRGFWRVAILAMLFMVVSSIVTNGVDRIFRHHVGPGAFYKVISEPALEIGFGVLGVWFVGGWLFGAIRFWRDIKPSNLGPVTRKDLIKATSDALKLRYLGREGLEEERAVNRRWLHHLVAYGFILDFISTALGAFYSHVLHVQAPYPIDNPVVILGVLGGIGIIVGTAGLLYGKSKTERAAADENSEESGSAFSVSLLTIGVTGMLVLLLRNTAAMGVVLAIHLGTVASLFFTAPYSKFVHFVYRYLALLRYAQEERTVGSATKREH
ncbi:tricarballylate utilization 4Fe-4S protein TcuB [Alicyclobacillus tolerans]|uniref:tricarballylate utilization 4Fe-4S protein TcuB n=1 Tax=Alicyclobacillus tolerans TaxID=90970 RepID=UPI001F276F3E|nr:tricarballylate utilization 4Fe-4S protein TcuB [Alicyclobacillus tolerans]MCF8567335.1 tricarballylate utilization 4Fe-4S protein TcuB [Alicyclobacillus tolerans]